MQLPTQDKQPAMTRSGYVIALYGALSLLALLIAAGRGEVDLYQLRPHDDLMQWLQSPLLGLVFGLAVALSSQWAAQTFSWANKLHREFRALLSDLTQLEIFTLAIASSVGEELLFRGALLPLTGPWLQGLLFGALHIGPSRQFLPWTLSAVVIGIGFGFLAKWSGDLGAPIAAHFVINFLNLRFIVRSPELFFAPKANHD